MHTYILVSFALQALCLVVVLARLAAGDYPAMIERRRPVDVLSVVSFAGLALWAASLLGWI